LLAVHAKLFEAFLYPLPVFLLLSFRQRIHMRMFLRVSLEHARADQVGGISNGMHQCLGVVDYEPPLFDTPAEPGDKMLT